MTDGYADNPTVEILSDEEITQATEKLVHVLAPGIICRTEARAEHRSRERIVLEATDGFIPLWAQDQVLRWRFNQASLQRFREPEVLKERVRTLFGAAVLAWGTAVPIRFAELRDPPNSPDFEIVVEAQEDCTPQGCVLASAFFPDAGRHTLQIYPTMFKQSQQEQMETIAHEIGHVFGLRHFFAPELEAAWPSVIFGTHKPFSIMNYGAQSTLTDTDRQDLTTLYQAVWQGQLTAVNGTPIQLVKPYHTLRT
jgi:hypothetical protein